MGTEIAERGPTAVQVSPKDTNSSPFVEAENCKAHGNECYKHRKYPEALAMYNQAINLVPNNASYYGNRAATYMMLDRFHEALQDARQSVHLDSTFVRGYQREAKCLLSIGDSYAALQSYRKVLELEPFNEAIQAEMQAAQRVHILETEARQDYERGDFRRAVYCMNQCLERVPMATKYKLYKAECLAFIGQYQEAQEIANSVVTIDNTNVDALFVRGLCMYYEDHVEKAQQHFREVLRLCPDHMKAKDAFRKTKQLSSKKEDGNAAFKAGRFEEAYTIYTEALAIDQLNRAVNAKLFCNRALACTKLNKLPECLEDCTRALDADPNYVKAYLRRAKCCMDMGKYEEAVRDYETAYNKEGARDTDTKQRLLEAKLELKKSKRKDYYKILGVSKDASDDDIKKAYKKRALIHHPDRHSHDTPEKQRDEELKFKELGEAYAVLSDPKKKARFDSGQDMEEASGPGDFDPNTIFQMFFGGGGAAGGMEDMFVGGAPRGHRHHGRRGGFPGAPSGYTFQF